jgi:hypothetical protein
MYPNYFAFAALIKDGTVVTWGDSTYGGNSSNVQSELHDIVEFSPSYTKFPNQ